MQATATAKKLGAQTKRQQSTKTRSDQPAQAPAKSQTHAPGGLPSATRTRATGVV